MFYKTLSWEVKADTKQRKFTGYASKFGNIDLHGDIIEKGAFAKTIQERMPKKAIKVLWQHMDPLGMPEVLEEDESGLYVEGRISKTRLGDEAMTLMDDGVVDGMSIGYDVVKDEFDDQHGIRRLKELKLYEVSVVTWGANPEAMVTNVKHLQALNDIFKDENLRDLGEVKKLLEKLNDTFDSGVFGTKDGSLIINMEELKAGRVLSKKNKDNLRGAVTLIEEVLQTAGAEDEPENENEKDLNLEDDMELKDLLSEIRSYAKK